MSLSIQQPTCEAFAIYEHRVDNYQRHNFLSVDHGWKHF